MPARGIRPVTLFWGTILAWGAQAMILGHGLEMPPLGHRAGIVALVTIVDIVSILALVVMVDVVGLAAYVGTNPLIVNPLITMLTFSLTR